MRTARRHNQRFLTFGVLVVLSVGLISLGSRSGVFRPVLSAIMVPLNPILGALNWGADAALTAPPASEDYETLRDRSRELERTVAELQVEIVRLREIEQDYYRLAGLVNYAAERPDQNLIAANIIARDTSGYNRWIVINQGARQGIKVGNPVISDLGLVGRVEEVAATVAWIRLANDPASLINAVVQGAGAHGLIVGQLQGNLLMEKIPQEYPVEVGALVLTSGLGGTFPPNIVIGQVTNVSNPPAELFQQAQIRPTVDFEHLEIVAVIISFQPLDLSVFDGQMQGAEP